MFFSNQSAWTQLGCILWSKNTHTVYAWNGKTGSDFELQSTMLQLSPRVENDKSATHCGLGSEADWAASFQKTSTFCKHNTLDTHNISWQHLASMLAKPLADNLLSGLINALARWMNGEMCQFYEILLCLLVFLLPWCFPFMKAKKKKRPIKRVHLIFRACINFRHTDKLNVCFFLPFGQFAVICLGLKRNSWLK